MDFIRKKFPSLKHKNFRMLWFLEIFSLLGVWIQSTSQSWLVYKLTSSPFFLGLVSAMQFMPVLILSVFAGVIIDNFPKRKVLLLTQYSLAILAFVLGVLVISGYVKYWHILVFASLLGIINTFDMPTRHSIIMEFVGSEDVMNAVSLNSATFNVARMVGPAIAGVLMKYIGIGYCFIITAILYIPIIIFLATTQQSSVNKKKINIKGILTDVLDGIKYILSKKVLYVLIFLVIVMGIFALNYSVFIPVLAKDVLKMDSSGYGNLMSSLGVGAFLGSMVVSLRSKDGPKLKFILYSILIVATTLVFSGYATTFILVALLLAITGFFNNVFFTNANSMLMINSEDEYRGRVMSIYTLAFSGTSPIGNLFCGTLIDKVSVKSAFVWCGSIIIVSVAVFLAIEWYFYRKQEKFVNEVV